MIMKKVLFIGMIFGGLAFTSCTKDYKCTYDEVIGEETQTYNDIKKSEVDDLKKSCQDGGGEWSVQ